MKVAIQGELGSFSHEAARRMLPDCTITPCAHSEEVFDRVARGMVGIIPIENSLAGPVTQHFDLLLEREVFVQKEFRLRIVHNLIAPRGVKRRQILKVLSHPVALDQCRDFFRKNPRFESVPFYDTAGSVKHIVESGLRDAAGIAGKQAAAVYKAQILAAGIEDNKKNFTRFFLIRNQRRILPSANKTSLVFGLKNAPGSLFEALRGFAFRRINLSKIESRPVRGRPWEYVFYVDLLEGQSRPAREALRELEKLSKFLKVLGIYQAA